jgi:hypothetical protein
MLLLAVDFLNWLMGATLLFGLLGWHPPGWLASPVAYGIYNAYATAKKVNSGILPYKNVSAGTLIIYAVLGFVVIFVGVVIITIILAAIIAAFVFSTGSVVSTGY